MSVKYLYGAAVQGIQGFIFQTNKLREIAGASELVEEICTTLFEPFHKDVQGAELILGAAGNIKCIFSNEADCQQAVYEFPRKVIESAPGITISQAVVKYDESTTSFEEAVEKLENRLRAQRNKPIRSGEMGAIGMERSRRTGLPTVCYQGKEHEDLATIKKLQNSTGEALTDKLYCKLFGPEYVKANKIPDNIGKLESAHSWIAIIHADGNGLGRVVQKVGKKIKDFKEFSKALDNATVTAAHNAAIKVMQDKKANAFKEYLPIRPVVLGGDDLTVICRGDIALDFTKAFLEEFEKLTKEKLGSILSDNKVFESNKEYLSACAGIAYIKSSYPFYYGYDLAESLCSAAKKVAKAQVSSGDLPASCLMFHKVQDSYIENYAKIVNRELTVNENTSWQFGPYYIDNKENRNFWTVDNLIKVAKDLSSVNGNAVKSNIRQWMSLMHDSESEAAQRLKRIKKVIELAGNNRELHCVNNLTNPRVEDGIKYLPAYDVLAIHSIIKFK